MKFLILFSTLVVLSLTSTAYADEYFIDIPFGAYNPELNTPADVWYDPPQMFATVGDTITWYNDDKEGHTVTSGEGSGRFGWMSDNFGKADGYFDSDRFMPGESWSYKFEESGTYSYYCIIHPWMEGVVIVEKEIPDYPHDATGKKLEFPLLQYTPDRNIEVNLTWDPPIIKTHEKIQFVYQFYDPQTNSNLAKMKYDFIIFQNGKEIFHDEGINQIGGDYRNFIFSDSGSVIIRMEGIHSPSILADEGVTVSGNVENKVQRSVDFSTAVYDNPEKTSHEIYHSKPAQRLEIYYELMIIIILVPAVLFIGALLWLKRKPDIPQSKPGAVKI
ncbi:MAG: plastocyanin/azurin family copper-binding protein [Nitrosopumilus sp.]|nr:plastocyanin/azurin family copper-binding protein [Nitrosopumilus sp.]MDH3823472.1 plastocyanin/azurin family copper-binding protein [Nitrosopumilus sp.]MDH3833196.1 plastocyanin/azurin family copper-binding protein [Nitrosopumilus sp.]